MSKWVSVKRLVLSGDLLFVNGDRGVCVEGGRVTTGSGEGEKCLSARQGRKIISELPN